MTFNQLPTECKNALLALLPVVESYDNLMIIQSIVDNLLTDSGTVQPAQETFLKEWLEILNSKRSLHKDLIFLYKALILHEIN
jgi:hypothetical protein